MTSRPSRTAPCHVLSTRSRQFQLCQGGVRYWFEDRAEDRARGSIVLHARPDHCFGEDGARFSAGAAAVRGIFPSLFIGLFSGLFNADLLDDGDDYGSE